MLIKGCLNTYFMRLFYHLKNIGIPSLIPIVIFILFVPWLNYREYTINGIDEYFHLSVIRYSQWLMPFFSVWNVMFALCEPIEADGYELFYTPHQCFKIIDLLGIFGISLIFITALHILYGFILPNMWFEYIRVLSICLLFLGIVYGMTNLFKSITPTILVLILYVFGTVFTVEHEPVFLLFYIPKTMTWQLFLEYYLVLVVMGCLFFLVGYYTSKKYY